MEAGRWTRDPYGVNYGNGELHATARDVARFGLLYLDGGEYRGRRVVPAEWVEASLRAYSSGFTNAGVEAGAVGRYFRDIGYGYQWWSARVGEERFDYAWGHGGQLVVLLHDRDMVIVTLADPFYRPIRGDQESWRHEQAVINLVGKFIWTLGAGG